MNFQIRGNYGMEGLYWYEIFWESVDDDHLVTRIPLRIVYERSVLPVQTSGPGNG